jgi:GGDEF domain-containing protein
MDNVPSPIENENSDYGAAKISADLRRLERRDLWAWMNAVVIILGLAGAVFSLSASLQWMGMKTVLGADYRVAVRALVILVLAFTSHTIYQQVKLRKLQRELKEQHVQAEVFRRLAMFDPLTGLCNRRFAEQRLKAEIARSERRDANCGAGGPERFQGNQRQVWASGGRPGAERIRPAFEQLDQRIGRGGALGWRRIHDAPGGLRGGAIVASAGAAEGFEVQAQGKTLPVSVAAGRKAYEPGDRVEELIEAADRRLYDNQEIVKKREPAAVAEVQ